MLSMESSIVKGILYNESYAAVVLPHLNSGFFDSHYRTIFDTIINQYEKYSKTPTMESLAIDIQKLKVGEDEIMDISETLESVFDERNEPIDTDFLIKETELFIRDKAIYNNIYKSIEILEGKDKHAEMGMIPELLTAALNISFTSDVGTEFFDDAEERYDSYVLEEDIIRLPLDALNILASGGLRKKTLSAILAGVNVGKSAMMAYLSGELIKLGYNVLYISMEMAETPVHQRLEANLLNVPTDKLKDIAKEEYISKIADIKSKGAGRFYTKQFPTAGAHVGHFKYLLKELKSKKGFVPDVIMLDYINICASSRYKSMSGVNSYTYVKAIAEEVRGMAVEFDVAILTATQLTREGYKDSNPDMTATSESFGLPASLDWFIAVTQDEVLAAKNQQRASLLKTRWGNKSKIHPQMLGINFDLMRYYDLSNETQSFKTESDKVKERSEIVAKRKKKDIKDDIKEIDWG